MFSLVAQLCPTLCDPMDCSAPGLPVHHQLPKFTQTHVHWVRDAIQPSHPLSSPTSCLQSFPASGSFQMSQLFASGGQSMGASASDQSFQWIFRADFLQDWLVWSLCSPRDSQESSPAPQFESISSSMLSLWCSVHMITWTQTLPNSMKLWTMLCRATQDGWVMVESSDKSWSTGEGNGKPLQHSCLENPMKSMKRQKPVS